MFLVSKRYEKLVDVGQITFDPAQFALAERFDDLLQAISEHNAFQPLLFWHRFKRKKKNDPCRVKQGNSQGGGLQGLYIHGTVGCGKTMLMDLFFSCLPQDRKKRVHFNDFMAHVHERINAHRQELKKAKSKQNDSILAVAKKFAQEVHVLCFDEFSVTDIADAMILNRFVTTLFNQGVIWVSTSNIAPDDLYRNGLNRELFLPFIQVLKNHVHIINLDAKTDYRLAKTDHQDRYMTPLGPEADECMDREWVSALQGQEEIPEHIEVMGRSVFIPRSAVGCVRFDYQELCAKPLAAAEYLRLVERYHTVFIDNVPIMDDTCRNEAKRFILLIDILYEHKIRLFMSAEVGIWDLYRGYLQTTERFEFQRIQSRLFEMQSRDYLNTWSERFFGKRK